MLCICVKGCCAFTLCSRIGASQMYAVSVVCGKYCQNKFSRITVDCKIGQMLGPVALKISTRSGHVHFTLFASGTTSARLFP